MIKQRYSEFLAMRAEQYRNRGEEKVARDYQQRSVRVSGWEKASDAARARKGR
jgi:hypothetical protein